MTWRVVDDDGNPIPQEAEIEITEMGMELIKEELKKLDKQSKLKEEHFSLYEKFIED